MMESSKLTILGQDIDEYLRCPYRLIKCKKEGIKPSEYLESEYVQEVLIKEGIKFEEDILSKIEWEKTKEPLDKLVKKRCIIKHPYLEIKGSEIRSDVPDCFSEIKLIGVPDIILPDEKQFYPVPLDIKSHQQVTKIDRYRISFYSILLNAKFKTPISKGLILTKNGIVEIDTSKYFRHILWMVQEVYNAINGIYSIRPQRSNECRICSLWEDCLADLKKRKDTTLIYNIGPKTADKLKNEGINTIDDLLCQDKYRLFKLRARSLIDNKIIKISDLKIPDGNRIFFDIETEGGANEKVWLIGYSYQNKFEQLYADSWKQGKKIVKDFLSFLESVDTPKLVSCSCMNFDWNVISYVLKKYKLNERFFQNIPHYDLGSYLRRSYILPIMSYKVKDMGNFLGYPFKHDDLNGLEVAMAYLDHLKTGKPLSQEYFEYNKDDVMVLPHIIDQLNTRRDIVVEILDKSDIGLSDGFGIPWSQREFEILKEKYPTYGSNIEELINNGRSKYSIRAKARDMKIRCLFRGPKKKTK